MSLRSRSDLATRAAFIELGEREQAILKENHDVLKAALPAALDHLYAQIRRSPDTAALFEDGAQMVRAKQAQARHWISMIGEGPGAEYEERASRIGRMHARIGLEPQVYMSSYALVLSGVIRSVVQQGFANIPDCKAKAAAVSDIISAAVKGAVLDMGIVVDAYLEASDAASEAKSHFIANMSHELRTPLNAIIGYTELVRENIADCDPNCADLDRVVRAARHLLGTINQVLDLSKIEAGRLSLKIETVDPAAAAGAAMETIAPLALGNGNTLALNAPAGLPALQADALKLNQCLLNLLSNAAKFTSNGAIWVEIEHERGEANDDIIFTVRDTGIGIGPDQIDRIFHRFEQADDRFGGTGLGLSITRSLATAMGAKVAVESALGGGSAFSLRMPRRGPKSAAPPLAQPAAAA